MRNPSTGGVQRFLCKTCGYRFSDPKRIQPLQINLKQSLNTPDALFSNCQICAFEAKNLEPQTETKTVAGVSPQADAKGTIVQFDFWQLKQGYSEATIKGRVKLLNRLIRLGANLNDEDSIKGIIATQKWKTSRKVNAVDAYDSLLKMLGKSWTPPIYKRVRTLPHIPTESEIDQLVAATSNRISTYLQLLKETGMRCGEASQLKWTDFDFENRSVRITPEKGSNPRILPISTKLIDMLNSIPKNAVTVFGVNSDLMRRNYSKQRKSIAFKLKNPRIQQITFHTFRHWKATWNIIKPETSFMSKKLAINHSTIQCSIHNL